MGMAQQAAARFNHIVGHSRAVIAAAFAVAIGCAACAGSPARPTAPASAASAGCARSSVAGLDRRFVISIDPRIAAGVRQRTAVAYIPASYRPGHPAPLIMEFHGAGPDATAAGYERSSPLRKLADAKGFIDVFPQALRAPNGNLAWNAYGPVIWKVAAHSGHAWPLTLGGRPAAEVVWAFLSAHHR
ncbi:MAG TPA: hypothetical protein VF070_40220 [Streptosporangiaceae bacterium]